MSFKGPQGERGTDGAPGKDGTGVTILGSYDSLEALKAEHATGNAGDAYLIGGHLYVWDTVGAGWKNVGTIQGPKGDKGEPGTNGKDGTNGVNGLGWTYGHGVPSSTGVPVGSLYLDLDTGNVYAFNAYEVRSYGMVQCREFERPQGRRGRGLRRYSAGRDCPRLQ